MRRRTTTLPVFGDRLAYSIEEAAGILAIGKTAVYQQLLAGNLIGRKIGGRTVILRDDLVAFVRKLPTIEAKGE